MNRTLRFACLLAFAGCLSTTSLRAADTHVLEITLTNGTTVSCAFDQKPEMLFEGNHIVLTSTAGQQGQWEFSDVQAWAFRNSSAVNSAPHAQGNLRFSGRTLTAEGMGNAVLHVFDLSGRKVLTHTLTAEQATHISLATLTRGTYVVQVGQTSLKCFIP